MDRPCFKCWKGQRMANPTEKNPLSGFWQMTLKVILRDEDIVSLNLQEAEDCLAHITSTF